MEIKAFYKELFAEVTGILKPHGFRKKGNSFRFLSDSGIAWEILFDRQDSNLLAMHRFRVEIFIDLFPVPVPADAWKQSRRQISGSLGDHADECWLHAKDYDLSPLVNPKLGEKLRDRKMPLTFQEPGKDWQTIWIPCPGFDEIIREVSDLLQTKFLPLFQSVRTPEDFAALLDREEEFFIHKPLCSIALWERALGTQLLPLLDHWIGKKEEHLEMLLSKDTSSLRADALRSHESTIALQREFIAQCRQIRQRLLA